MAYCLDSLQIIAERKKMLSFLLSQIYLHGNNLSTLHEHLPTDILPAELGGTGPAFNPGLWAEPVIHSAMKEAELAAAATKKGKERQVDAQEPANLRDGSETANGNHQRTDSSNVPANADKTSLNNFDNPAKHSSGRAAQMDVELNVINKRSIEQRETTELATRNDEDDVKERLHVGRVSNGNVDEQPRDTNDLTFLDTDVNLNEFEMIPSRSCSESSRDNSLDNRLEGKALITAGNNETPSEETNLIT
ncbi:uncharacterized protein LOC105423918 [Pogonomyrmex barbatus]|uniref:Uncharacterized protein LOC105423918 n=1 Tax=Pogonomyrmex barbatus TaxID=144034 RepID=A0A6I9WKE3_9HYME|nr:uncharacterized protein LOC105423918 [Pogonomyrmex barbatus]